VKDKQVKDIANKEDKVIDEDKTPNWGDIQADNEKKGASKTPKVDKKKIKRGQKDSTQPLDEETVLKKDDKTGKKSLVVDKSSPQDNDGF